MRLTFLGTRGEIPIRSRRHARHTSTEVAYLRRRIVIDLGEDWRGRGRHLAADAVVVTHAHVDHVGGLRDGVACPVYATPETWEAIGDWPVSGRHVLSPWTACDIAGVTFEAVPVEHSVRAPAVGYRITAGAATVFYVPDVAAIPESARALAGVSLYVGDGATLNRPLLKRREGILTGHTSIAAQLDWCRVHGVPRAIFTHCGSSIVGGDARVIGARIAALGHLRGVVARLAHDGLAVQVR